MDTDLTGWIIGYRAGIVVVCPVLGVVVKLRDIKDFIFSLYIPVLCDTNIDTDFVFGNSVPV